MMQWLASNAEWLIPLCVVGLLILMPVIDGEDCPRAILGYTCRGKNCDHSEELVLQSKKAMEGNIHHDHEQGQTR